MRRNSAGEPAALVTNIQKYTIHDGPGIRTEIFFKGCPLSCPWCSNPETGSAEPELGIYPKKCVGRGVCSLCADACPEPGRIRFDDNGVLTGIQRAPDCAGCLKCAGVCPGRAIKLWGQELSLSQLTEIVMEDESYYKKSGGGVTLSGGEVMLQWEFAARLLAECRARGVHTCVESALFCAPEHLRAVLAHTELLIFDIKHMDSARHAELTGVGNELILSNIRLAAELGIPLVARTPVIPGVNDDTENIRATGAFLASLPGGLLVQYQLLPYRKMGTEKYDSLEREYTMGNSAVVGREDWEARLLELVELLRDELGLPAAAGSGKKLELPGG